MSELEKLVRCRMQEEFAKGASADEISMAVRRLFNSFDLSGYRMGAALRTGAHRE